MSEPRKIEINSDTAQPSFKINREAKLSDFAAEPSATSHIQAVASNADEFPIRSSKRKAPGREAKTLFTKASKVPGVIQKIRDQTVLVKCRLPSKAVEIELPLSILPVDCRRFAAPIWVEVDKSRGLKRLVVTDRGDLNEGRAKEASKLPKEIADWLAK